METLRVLVTGSSGFLGRNLVEHLLSAGFEVVGFDLREPAYDLPQFVQGDFMNERDLVPNLRNIDGVCHLGGIGDIYVANTNPELALRVNALGTFIVRKCCAQSGVESLVFASTWEVYGQPQFQPVTEVHPCNPQTPYSISKLAAELFARSSTESELRTTILRLGTAYGRHMRENSVFSRFVARGLAGKPIQVFGTGQQHRQFTHASDIAEAFRLSLNRNPGGVFNIVSSEVTTILNLAKQIAARYGVEIEYLSPRGDDPPPVYVDSGLARRELRWTEKTPFQAGLRDLLYHLETELSR